jgi:hypothetical protein
LTFRHGAFRTLQDAEIAGTPLAVSAAGRGLRRAARDVACLLT